MVQPGDTIHVPAMSNHQWEGYRRATVIAVSGQEVLVKIVSANQEATYPRSEVLTEEQLRVKLYGGS